MKSMGGERLEQAELSARGIAGDRAYALVDAETGKVVSAKSVKRFPGILHCRAEFVEPPGPAHSPPARIFLPNAPAVTTDSPDAERILSEHFKRDVTIARSAPDDFTIDMYHPDIEGFTPEDRRGVVMDQKLGAAFFVELGTPSPVAAGLFFDLFPISVVTNSSLNRLNQLQPQSCFDERRFRMNIVINATASGFVENNWVGRVLKLGETVKLRVVIPDPRCVMTSLAQADLPHDPDILRGVARHNMIPVATAGDRACVGVYAVVEAPGVVRTGDLVTLI